MMTTMRIRSTPPKQPLSRWLIVPLLGIVLFTSINVARANARQDIEEQLTFTDARLVDYPQNVYIEGGISTTWFLLIFLGLVGLSVLFKDARRTHLD